jgi:CelD/BcsL family acetyltransferase involved in cellulose biosynthesis
MTKWNFSPLIDSLADFTIAWDTLVNQNFQGHCLLDSTFVNGLLRNFGSKSIYLAWRQGDSKIDAMCILRKRSPFLWESFLPSQAQLGMTLISEGTSLSSLVNSLPFPAVQLNLLSNDPVVRIDAFTSTPLTHRLNHSLTMSINLDVTFETYWGTRNRQLQSNIKRSFRKLEQEGCEPQFVKISDPDQIDAAIERYAALEQKGWKGRIGTALGSSPAQLSFYRRLLSDAASLGRGFVVEYWISGILASSRLLLCNKHRQWVILKTTHEESLARFAPGRLLLHRLIQEGFETNPGGVLEFYTDANPDQLAWATAQRWIQHHSFFKSSWVDVLGVFSRGFRSRFERRPKSEVNESVDAANVCVFEKLEELPDQALVLLSKSEARNIEFGPDWYRNLVHTVFPNHPSIRFYVLFSGKVALAVFPIRAERTLMGWQIESLGNFYTTLYEPSFTSVLKTSDLRLVLSAIQASFPRLISIRLSPLDPSSHAYQTMLSAFRLQGWFPFEFFSFGNWYLPVNARWPDYLASRSSTMKNTIKRMGKKFHAEGGHLQVVFGSKSMGAAISAYERVYAASWKKPEPYPEFSPGLINLCAERGWLRLGLAWLNDRPIAAQLWIVAGGRAEIYKVAYDEEFKAFSPGTLLTALLMEHAIEVDKVYEVDYLIGDDPYKKTWMSHRRERWGIVAYNTQSMFGAFHLMMELVRRTIKPWLVKIRKRRTENSRL